MIMSNLIKIRILQHDTEDRIRIGSEMQIRESALAELVERVIAKYDKETEWCGGFAAAYRKYYKRIAIVNADTLETIQNVEPLTDNK